MARKHRLLLLGAGVTVSHFLATWFLTLLSWTHAWANRVVDVLWFPGSLVLNYLDGCKLTTMSALFVTSMGWGSCFVVLMMLARWRR